MTDRSASSLDDLEQARRASRRLRGQGAPGARPGYIRFSSSGLIPPAAAEATFGPAVWNEMLERCARDAGAEVAFVTDAQGLVVASRGAMDPALIEGVGARLLIAFEQADQMGELGTTTHSIAIEIGRRWLTGFRVRRGENRLFTVGALGPAVVPRETREAIEAMLER